MRKSVVLFAVPVLAWAQMQITAVERVNTKAVPDVLRGEMVFEEHHRDAETIRGHMNAIVAAVKKGDPEARICRGGGYRLYPRYSYRDQKQEFLGYGGHLSFACDYPDIAAYDALNGLVDKSLVPGVRKTQGALSWSVSEPSRERLARGLRLELLGKAKEEAEALSAATALMCRPEKIAFIDGGRPMPVMLRAMEASGGTESPLRGDEEISVEASVDYACVKRVP